MTHADLDRIEALPAWARGHAYRLTWAGVRWTWSESLGALETEHRGIGRAASARSVGEYIYFVSTP